MRRPRRGAVDPRTPTPAEARAEAVTPDGGKRPDARPARAAAAAGRPSPPADQAAAKAAARPARQTAHKCFSKVWCTVHRRAGDPPLRDDWSTRSPRRCRTSSATTPGRLPEPKSDGTAGRQRDARHLPGQPGRPGPLRLLRHRRRRPAKGPYDASAYCALDNDYAEFPTHTPLENLQVTAAHELFHAIQFAYDTRGRLVHGGDRHLGRGRGLRRDQRQPPVPPASPLTQPGQPLDQFNRNSLRQYGEWIFFRYLTERFPSRGRHAGRGAPAVGARRRRRGEPDDYSIQAVNRELAEPRPEPARCLRRVRRRQPAPGPRPTRRARATRAPGRPARSSLTPTSRDTGWRRVRRRPPRRGTVAVRPSASMKRYAAAGRRRPARRAARAPPPCSRPTTGRARPSSRYVRIGEPATAPRS